MRCRSFTQEDDALLRHPFGMERNEVSDVRAMARGSMRARYPTGQTAATVSLKHLDNCGIDSTSGLAHNSIV
jgi:hypothetical protein